MTDQSRDELLRLTPAVYLRDGFRRDLALRPEMVGLFATAAALQFADADAPPQEVTFLLEALRQTLPLHDGFPRQRFEGSLSEALDLVSQMTRKEPNPGLVRWARACAPFLSTDQDVQDFLVHLEAAARQHTVFVAVVRQTPSG